MPHLQSKLATRQTRQIKSLLFSCTLFEGRDWLPHITSVLVVQVQLATQGQLIGSMHLVVIMVVA
jgi:hypothetical protein